MTHHAPQLDALRARAEQALHTLQQALQPPEHLSAQALDQLVHELRAYQSALEQQHEQQQAIVTAQAEQLAYSETRFKALVEHLPLGVVVIDRHYRIQYASPTFERLFGVCRGHFDHQPCYEQLEQRTSPCPHCAGTPSLLDGQLHETQTQGVRSDGSRFDVHIHAFPLLDEQGQAHGFIEIVEDITTRLQLENQRRASEEKMRLIMRNASIGLALCDTDGRWLEVNPALCAMLGYTAEEMLRLDAIWMTAPQDQTNCQQLLSHALEGPNNFIDTEKRFICKDGRTLWARSRGTTVRDAQGKVLHWIFEIEDIGLRRAAEAELRLAMQAAEAANVAKSQFLATMSHELRTPMNGMLGMAQMLLLPGITEGERHDYASTILSSGQSLLTLLNDILDLSKIEAGKINLETIALHPPHLLEEVGSLFVLGAQHKGLSLEQHWEGPACRYLGDPHRLRQILTNLLGNAIKFTPKGSVRLTGRELGRHAQGAELEFRVADTGIGISPEAQQRLFQPFSQADNSITRQYGGTGLGLIIVRRLAQAMGGDAGVDSTLGQGSDFWIRICLTPLDDEPQPTHPLWSTEGASPSLCGHILVVEDEPSNQKVMAAYLQRMGLDCTLASDGREALRTLALGCPAQAILMDIHMPEMDGFETTQRLRAWEAAQQRPPCPVVALTADVQASVAERCRAVGMDEVLTKPVMFQPLLYTLQRWLPTRPTPPLVPQPVADPQRVRALLAELAPLLAERKFAALRCLQALADATAGSDWAAQVKAARRDLEHMDFESAAARLQAWLPTGT